MGMSSGQDAGQGSLQGHASGTMMAEINITPMVDVMLVLLIIFMVTTPLLQQGVEVALPKTQAPGLKSAETTLIIAIKADQTIYMAKEEVDQQGLAEKLAAIMEQNPNKQVYLKADEKVPYGSVAQAMAIIKRAGVTKLGMVTQPGEQGSQ